jgi:hypothetical protein
VEVSSTVDPVGINFGLSTDGGVLYHHTCDTNNSGAVISSGQWHHVASTYDGTALQLYIDGTPWGKPMLHSGTISSMLTNSFVTLGSEDGRTVCPFCIGERYFSGLMDEVTLYNRALTPAEVSAIYNAGRAGKFVP